MGGVVVFDPAEFRDMFPEHGAASDAVLTRHFLTACLLVDNTPASPIPLTGPEPLTEPRKQLLYLAIAHLLELSKRGVDGVGQVTAASQGSVNVSFATIGGSDTAQWWNLTTSGGVFWWACLPYRMGPMYVSG